MENKPLPELATDTAEVYLDPGAQFRGCPHRPRLAQSHYGTELLAYEDVRNAFLDRRMTPRTVEYYERLGASPVILEFVREGNLNFMPAEKHDRIRAIIGKAFTRTRIESFRPSMRQIAEDSLAAALHRGECDLVADLCHLYPITVFARFMGVPTADVPSFADATVQTRLLGQVPFQPGMPALEAALTFMKDYIVDLVAERRAAPRDDLVDALIALQASGEQLSEDELIWGLAFLLLAGHDTTRFTLSACLHTLIAQGLWETAAADPDMIPAFIAESMRFRPGTPRQMRIVAESWEMEGHRFETGDVVSLNLGAASRDPEAFAAAEEFQLGRDPGYVIGFGFGRHICIGQLLAKTEMVEAIAAATRMLTSVELAADCAIKPTGVIAGFDSLPIRFRPR